MEFVRGLAGVGAADRPVAGGKGASLGELAAAGVRVPPGCVVTTRAFDLTMAAVDPDGAARREVERVGTAEAAGRMRERILAAPVPAAVGAEIAGEYRALSGPGEGGPGEGGPGQGAPVAVRSSATLEDSGDASFAGVQDTYLWVLGEAAVTDNVRRCWASLYSDESVSYRRRLLAPAGDPPAMAVVIQRMVDARCSGVMFTCSPTTGDRSVVAVEAAWGLGSALVSGCVTPDSYVVSKVTGEITKRTVAAKHRLHRRGPDGTGVVEEDVAADLREVPCLSEEEIGALVRIARQVEDHYGSPQDIEWAITGDGAGGAGGAGGIFVLQSRPETVWAARDAGPVATPKRRAFDHVFDRLSGRTDGTVTR
jgi:pyruvate,water dikinase